MIQGTINQLIYYGAAAKKAADISKAKEAKEKEKANKASLAKEKALKRAQDKINMKYAQNKQYKEFVKSLGDNQAPEMLKRLAFERSREHPEVKLGKEKVDISKFSQEAQQLLRGVK